MVSRTLTALQEQGFGVLTEIDVKETLKKKLDVDFRRYRILGACNPALAYEALQLEDKVGTMLPCNVIVQDKGDGATEVAAIDPVSSMQAIDNPDRMFGWEANPHFGAFHLLSFVFIGGGFVLIAKAWKVLYDAQRQGSLATTGPYAYVRHPQYLGFVLIMFGFLLQWPTLLTLAMFPVLVWMYARLLSSSGATFKGSSRAFERAQAQILLF